MTIIRPQTYAKQSIKNKQYWNRMLKKL